MGGFMMHGVAYVAILDVDGIPRHWDCDGRVYQWSSGAISLYREDGPWIWFPPRRVHEIVGKEKG